MSRQIQAIRGMNDILPEDTPYWQFLEDTARAVLAGWGYAEIRLPILEKTELFSRSIGEVTDIVEKEMYTFTDRNGDSLTLRPEGTAGCVRAGIQNALLRTQQRLWYMGPMFRHERPQKGRYRQFHQIGVEAYGIPGPDVDAEIILMAAAVWERLGLSDLTLELNSLGNPACRADYRATLVAFLSDHMDALDDDSRRRLDSNPLRILDSKNPEMADLLARAPSILDHLDTESREHFEGLHAMLDAAGVAHQVNHRMVRGLDYYGKTVFEWTTNRLGAQGTVCAGGRYDILVEQLGGKPVPAVGFAMGLERLVSLLGDEVAPPTHHVPHAYLVILGDAAALQGPGLARTWRAETEGLRLLMNCGNGSFKSQLKRASRSGAPLALILGDDEIAHRQVGIKYLREDRQQEQVPWQTLGTRLVDVVKANP